MESVRGRDVKNSGCWRRSQRVCQSGLLKDLSEVVVVVVVDRFHITLFSALEQTQCVRT